ncbi:MAG: YeeE/YedE thiosulfate transporter family protein [Gammaproteobacteria bacterium]|nr:YeeE/YedE thiosulfate transporter family protein [Gammaproteobacteria bacterium]
MVPLTLLALGLLCAVTIGYLAQWTGICMVRGVALWETGKPALLIATVFCGAWTWICVPLATVFGVDLPMHRYEPALLFALGGFVFGIGAAVNNGCAVSTLSKLACGQVHMLAAVAGWIAGWTLWLLVQPESMLMRATATPTYAVWLLVAVSVGLTLWAFLTSAEQRRLWLGITAFGIAAGVLTLVESQWSPSSVITDLSAVLARERGGALPSVYRIGLVLTIVLGMALAAWRGGFFRWRRLRLARVALHLGGGTLMGIGAAMALGGNDVQLLAALPALSPGGLIAVPTMLAGTWLGLRLMDRARRG